MMEGQHTVLVVDDDKSIRDTICEVLEEEGYVAVACADGQEALDVLRTGRRFCLVLLDLMMPRKDGWAFRQEQQADPAIASVPVVVVSASVLANASALGAVEFLQKPVSFNDILHVVQAHC